MTRMIGMRPVGILGCHRWALTLVTELDTKTGFSFFFSLFFYKVQLGLLWDDGRNSFFRLAWVGSLFLVCFYFDLFLSHSGVSTLLFHKLYTDDAGSMFSRRMPRIPSRCAIMFLS